MRGQLWRWTVVAGYLCLLGLPEAQGAPVPRRRGRILKDVGGKVAVVVFAPDGKILATASEDKKVHFWEVPGGKEIRALPAQSQQVIGLRYTAKTNKGLAVLTQQGQVELYDTRTWKARWKLNSRRRIANPKLGSRCLAFTSDGQSLYFPYYGIILGGADAATGRLKRIMRDNNTRQMTAVASSPVGNRIAASGQTGGFSVFEANTGRVILTARGHTGAIRDICYSPDGKLVASCGEDGTIRLWSATNARQIRSLTKGKDTVHALVFHPKGDMLASAGADKIIHLWDLKTGRAKELKGHDGAIKTLAFSPDGKYLASGSDDKTVRIWEVRSR